MMCPKRCIQFLFLIVSINAATGIRTFTKDDLLKLREEVKEMFYHAYDSYLKYAYPYDELRPISCDGIDTYGSYSLTLIDALGTLAIMGNYSEFQRVVDLLTAKPDFDANINVSVFETNIRVVGGLLSAHLLSNRAGVTLEPGWPCNGPLLKLAEDVAKRLVVAFDSKTGMPYGTINLRSGIPKGETAVTCTAGIGTYLIEFGTLSRLTGDPLYEEVALNAMYALYNHKSPLGLYGNHIDVETGRWTYQDAGIGSGVDSFFEYMVKGAILLQRPELLSMFHEARAAIDKYLKKDDWYMWVSMTKGQVTIPVFQSLEAYWPGVLSLLGDTASAMKTLHNYHQAWIQYGFTPEFYNIPQSEAGSNRESYPLRPELIESIMYLYRATNDPFLLQAGEDILRSIQHSAKTPCGYATIKDVRDHRKEDRMESFFLAETTKYLYLLFDTDNFIHNQGESGTVIETPNGECVIESGGYIFNTEAHPIDPGALHCCHNVPKMKLYDFSDIEEKRDMFRGDSIEERRTYKNNCTTDDDTPSSFENVTSREDQKQGLVDFTGSNVSTDFSGEAITTESSSSYVKMEGDDNSSIVTQKDVPVDSNKLLEDGDDNETLVEDEEEKSNLVVEGSVKSVPDDVGLRKFDVQEMLERFRRENKYGKNETWLNNFKILSCQAQPFLQKISIMGEMFKYD